MADRPPLQIDDSFIKAIQNEDALGAVVRGHLHIEAGLNDFLGVVTPFPEHLPDLSYSQKVGLACAFGLKEEHAPPLRALGKLRNDFAHKLSSELSSNAIQNLRSALGKTDRAAVEAAYRATNRSILQKDGGPFEKLTPQMQFALIAITLKGMITVAVRRAHERGQST